MEAIRIVIDLPADFDAQDAEVIVLPVKMLAEVWKNCLTTAKHRAEAPVTMMRFLTF